MKQIWVVVACVVGGVIAIGAFVTARNKNWIPMKDSVPVEE